MDLWEVEYFLYVTQGGLGVGKGVFIFRVFWNLFYGINSNIFKILSQMQSPT